mmetsp:Transcript_17162/g.35240  ORF Transcript_17162/g.35240 Transcript_17162/m.35240 type:complete len:583 (+) Transcript_17162:82-1830(+)|eukprot:CAMPEP_0201152208 /NCGR_PEP_ID=MMETSP0851-20130426/12938_1 /ASSEMBLY_ACC=CAM_ASM_000631 /TAXON_ID=183588 /ORGANISM="Pseudo-nitzschia fraudulenta, Strain WWA7" /LENGTH=582 /DNA_ID=CAMNT_0047429181 /DNA_START=149 /DNA_END=1897 /DNA_ORIENTATION=+
MTDIPQLPEMLDPLSMKSDVSRRRARQATEDLLACNDSNSRATDEVSTHRRSSLPGQDEGVLMDVLEELDRERQKRAEMEAKVRNLEQEVHIERRKSSKSSNTSVRDHILVKTERDGLKEILDALTKERPAFSTMSYNAQQKQKHQQQSLPIHIVRLLEVMPWDSRAQQYASGEERVYEWQIFTAEKKWQKELRYFPTFFKALPIVVPAQGKTMSDEVSKRQPYFGVTVSPPKQCVLTDLEGTTILNIDKGYPLPEDGGDWAWVGPWKVEKNNDTDEYGWTYSNEIKMMSDLSTYHGEFRVPRQGTANITKRRRKWIRPRSLVDYPYASNMTREYLKVIAEKSRLDACVEKLLRQLVDTKMELTTLEADQERTVARVRELEHALHNNNNSNSNSNNNNIPGLSDNGAELKSSKGETVDNNSRMSNGSSHSLDSTKKADDIRSAVTQWVSNTVHKQANSTIARLEDGNTTEGDGDQSTILSYGNIEKHIDRIQEQKLQDPKQQLLDSLRDKGTGLLEILKQKGEQLDMMKQNSATGGGGLPWQRKESFSSDKKDNDGCISTPDKPNVFAPSTRVRFYSNGSND